MIANESFSEYNTVVFRVISSTESRKSGTSSRFYTTIFDSARN